MNDNNSPRNPDRGREWDPDVTAQRIQRRAQWPTWAANRPRTTRWNGVDRPEQDP